MEEIEFPNMKETEQMDDFAMKFNDIVSNIRTSWEKIEESYVVNKLLKAVPYKFVQITFIIEQFGDLKIMLVEETICSLKANEERIRDQDDNFRNQFLLTKEEWQTRF